MRHIAIVGSGPAGYYTAEAAVKKWGEEARIDVFDMLPVPFGLIRTGVAPDHQSIKGVSRRYEKTAIGDTVRFVGNIAIGRDVSIEELHSLYDAVILATGDPQKARRRLKRAVPEPGDLQQLPAVTEHAVLVAEFNDVLGDGLIQTRHPC